MLTVSRSKTITTTIRMDVGVNDHCPNCCGDGKKVVLSVLFNERKIILYCERCGHSYLEDVEIEDE